MGNPWLSPEDTRYEGWEAFVKDHQLESTVLEYKDVRVFESRSGGRKLVQDVSAMANTYGGIMVLGVRGKDGSYAVQGFERPHNPAGTLRDRVVNLCLDMTWPPLLVHPTEVESADGTRVTVVMRLEPRPETPTFFHSEGERGCFECYVRADGRKYQPKSSDDGLEWFTNIDLAVDLPDLHGRAQKAAATRDEMLRLSRERCEIWLPQACEEIRSETPPAGTRFELAVGPLFPRGTLASRSDVNSWVRGWYGDFVRAHHSWFPEEGTITRCEAMGGGQRLTSIAIDAAPHHPHHWLYVEATDAGMVYCSLGTPGHSWPDREKAYERQTIFASDICIVAGGALDLAYIVCQEGHYPGPLLLQLDLGPGLQHFVLGDLASKLCTHSTWHCTSEIRSAMAADFWPAARKAVGDALEDLAWTFRAPSDAMPQIAPWVARFVGPG